MHVASLVEAGQAENLTPTGQETFTLSKKEKRMGLCSTVAASTNQLHHMSYKGLLECFLLRMLHREELKGSSSDPYNCGLSSLWNDSYKCVKCMLQEIIQIYIQNFIFEKTSHHLDFTDLRKNFQPLQTVMQKESLILHTCFINFASLFIIKNSHLKLLLV